MDTEFFLFDRAVLSEDLQAALPEDPRIAAIMHNVRQYAIDFEAHTGESTSNLDILWQRIEDGLRELAGLRAVQPELLAHKG